MKEQRIFLGQGKDFSGTDLEAYQEGDKIVLKYCEPEGYETSEYINKILNDVDEFLFTPYSDFVYMTKR